MVQPQSAAALSPRLSISTTARRCGVLGAFLAVTTTTTTVASAFKPFEHDPAMRPMHVSSPARTTAAGALEATQTRSLQGEPSLCSEEWKATKCPEYCTGYMEGMCCKYDGQTASMLTIEFPHNLAIYARREWFQNCTGANLAFTPYQAQGEGAFRPLFEVGEGAKADAESSGVYDSYMTQATAVNTFADYVEDLSPRIRVTPELQWTDILTYVRKMGAYRGEQLSIPFDLDFINILLRDDLRDAYEKETGKKQPRTWEEFADYVEHWHGRDLNGDGEPDMGICSLNGAGPGGPQAMLMAIASSKLQYLGANTGTWFDTQDPDAVPLFENDAFLEAAELTRRLWMHSIDDQPGGWTELHEDYWHNGRCAAYMWLTGSVALVLTKAPVRRCASYPKPCANEGPAEWANRTVLWEPQHDDGTYWEPRRVRSMGSAEVYDRSDGTMKSCTPEINPNPGEVNCPHLDPEEDERDGVWINRAPYYYSAYQHCSISFRKDAPKDNRDVLWDFVVMANLESAPVVSQALGPTYLDPFRRSHLTPETKDLYDKAWTEQQYEDLRRTFYWAGSTPNTVLPLSIPGQEDYELSMEMLLWQYLLDIGTDCTSKNDCKCRKYRTPGENCGYGWGDDPDVELWARSRASGGSLTKEEFASRLKARWDAITNTHGGGRAQIDRYRGTLGLDPLPKDDDWVMPLVIGLSATIGAILFFILAGWVYVTYREKKRLQKKREIEYERAILTAEEDAGALGHPMILCPAKTFVDLPHLKSYEELRDGGQLVFLDTLDKIQEFKARHLIVFLSHQWLGWGIPDPDNVHHNAMIEALRQVLSRCRRMGTGNSATLDDMYVWCDFVSIAQEHRPMQVMAVSSLPVYASIADAFVIVAPEAEHKNSGQVCNAETYSLRGWCRAEMLAKVCGTGLDHMYIIQGIDAKLVPVDHQWLVRLDLRVFEGQFSCCALKHKGTVKCDKESLMSPILGLYSLIIKQRNLKHIQEVHEHIEADKDRFFPHTVDFVTESGDVEERELFGPLVKKMEQRVIEEEADGAAGEDDVNKRMWRRSSWVSAPSSHGEFNDNFNDEENGGVSDSPESAP